MLQDVPLPILITKCSKCKSSSTIRFAIIQFIIYTTKCINYKLLILWLYKYLLSLTWRVAFTRVGLRNGEWLSPFRDRLGNSLGRITQHVGAHLDNHFQGQNFSLDFLVYLQKKKKIISGP